MSGRQALGPTNDNVQSPWSDQDELLIFGRERLSNGPCERFSNVLEQQSGRVSITLNEVGTVPGIPVESVATRHRESGIADPNIEETGSGPDSTD